MKKITFDKVTWNIPTQWSEITLGHFESFYRQTPKDSFEWIEYVSAVCKIDKRELLSAPYELFTEIVDSILFLSDQDFKPLSSVNIEGTNYSITTSEKLTLAEWVDADTALNQSQNKLSELLAILCRPENEAYNADLIEQRKEVFKNLSCDKGLPLIAFFLFKKKLSDEILARYLTVTDLANQYLKDIETSAIVGDGIKQLPIWQRIRYTYLTKCLKKELSKCSLSCFTNLTKQMPKKTNQNT